MAQLALCCPSSYITDHTQTIGASPHHGPSSVVILVLIELILQSTIIPKIIHKQLIYAGKQIESKIIFKQVHLQIHCIQTKLYNYIIKDSISAFVHVLVSYFLRPPLSLRASETTVLGDTL